MEKMLSRAIRGAIIQDPRIAQVITGGNRANVNIVVNIQNLGDKAVEAAAGGNELRDAMRFILSHIKPRHKGKGKAYWLNRLAGSVELENNGGSKRLACRTLGLYGDYYRAERPQLEEIESGRCFLSVADDEKPIDIQFKKVIDNKSLTGGSK